MVPWLAGAVVVFQVLFVLYGVFMEIRWERSCRRK